MNSCRKGRQKFICLIRLGWWEPRKRENSSAFSENLSNPGENCEKNTPNFKDLLHRLPEPLSVKYSKGRRKHGTE